MKKLLLTLSALTLCLFTGANAFFGRNGDCGSCKPCKRSCEKTCKPVCKPCITECKPACVTCEKPCKRTERQIVEVVVPCPRYVEVMDYKIEQVEQVREVCEGTGPVVGAWSCCHKNGRACGEHYCDACRSAGVSKDPVTGVLSNDPLYEKAKSDPAIKEKLVTAERYNIEHGVEADTTFLNEGKGTNYVSQENYASQEQTSKKLTKKQKAAQKKAARNNKYADKYADKNVEIIEETDALEVA